MSKYFNHKHHDSTQTCLMTSITISISVWLTRQHLSTLKGLLKASKRMCPQIIWGNVHSFLEVPKGLQTLKSSITSSEKYSRSSPESGFSSQYDASKKDLYWPDCDFWVSSKTVNYITPIQQHLNTSDWHINTLFVLMTFKITGLITQKCSLKNDNLMLSVPRDKGVQFLLQHLEIHYMVDIFSGHPF